MNLKHSEHHALWTREIRQKVLRLNQHIHPYSIRGRVFKSLGPMIEASGLQVSIGHVCDILCSDGTMIEAEVIGFRGEHTMLIPVGSTLGIAPGNPVQPRCSAPFVMLGTHLQGRVLDALGRPMDNRELGKSGEARSLHGSSLNPFDRHLIDTPMQTGIRAVDACLTMGWGQRIGLFAGAGVGKSSLLGMIARNSDADLNVIALIGERSREVREFLDRALGEDGLQRCIVVVATSDTSPVLRVRAALLATSIAEYFRDQGKQILLMMDSLTRLAQAQREIGLMLGEPPASKGYTPSCFSMLSRLLERAGPGTKNGDISAIYTVLVEGDDLRGDPVADASMAVLDGHVVLDRKLAEQGHFPAINILQSVSRLAHQLMTGEQERAVRQLRQQLALYAQMEDMVHLGAYEKGTNPELDHVLAKLPEIRRFLAQESSEHSSLQDSAQRLLQLMATTSP